MPDQYVPASYYNSRLYLGTSSDLVGKKLACFGYGHDKDGDMYWRYHNLQTANLTVALGYCDMTNCDCGDGYCVANQSLTVGGCPGPKYKLVPNVSEQILLQGDSGGPCFLYDGLGAWQTGLSSAKYPAEGVTTASYQTEAAAFRNWVWQTMGTPEVGGVPDGFLYCAGEYSTCNDTLRPLDDGYRIVAYGRSGQYTFRRLKVPFECKNGNFDRDPVAGTKSCYTRPETGPIFGGDEGTNSSWWPGHGLYRIFYGAFGRYVSTTSNLNYYSCVWQFFGQDPIPGVPKACYKEGGVYAPGGYRWCANQGGTCSFPGQTKVVAYGAQMNRVYKTITGSTLCTNEAFGGDPVSGIVKQCYVWP